MCGVGVVVHDGRHRRWSLRGSEHKVLSYILLLSLPNPSDSFPVVFSSLLLRLCNFSTDVSRLLPYTLPSPVLFSGPTRK